MLNDIKMFNVLFPHQFNNNSRSYYQPYYQYDDDEVNNQDYEQALAAALQQQREMEREEALAAAFKLEREMERQRREREREEQYRAAVARQQRQEQERQAAAYVEALLEQKRQEEIRQQRQRQYLSQQLQRNRQEEIRKQRQRQYLAEQEVERKRQEAMYLAALERERRQQMKRYEEERAQKQKAAAQAFKRRQQAKKAQKEASLHSRRSTRDSRPMYQIVQTPDGRLFKVLLEPTNDDVEMDRSNHAHDNNAKIHIGCKPTDKVHTEDDMEVVDRESDEENKVNVPEMKSITFNNCFNVHKSDSNLPNSTSSSSKVCEKKKKVAFSPSKNKVKSSVLVGDVEDASDSECEDEFSDIWHNRRPHSGEWIEPV